MLRFATQLLLLIVCVSGCRSTPENPVTPEAVAPQPASQPEKPPPPEVIVQTEVSCGEVPAGLEGWLSEGLLALGEMHGSVEVPRAVWQALCVASLGGKPVWLALEFPRDEQPGLDSFLTTGDEAALLQSPFWRSDYRDGRTSQAMLGLLREVRRLRAAGRQVRVIAVDATLKEMDTRDEQMAESIAKVRTQAPDEPMVFLAGNAHTRRRLMLPRPAVWHLAKRGVRLKTLLTAAREGTVWGCGVTCGVSTISGDDLGSEPRILETESATKGGHDGVWYLVAFTASPPA